MQTKRILLMHISNISGHRSATLAIDKAIKTQNPEAQTLTLNAFNYVHPKGERIINFFYMLTIRRFPFIWAYLYDNPSWVKRSQKFKDAINYANLPKLETLFNHFQPNVVVSTQAFPCGLVANFKRCKGINLPLIAVLTDFVPHSYWIYDAVDYYIAPSQGVRQKLIEKGVSPQCIKPFGIPFDLKFNLSFNKIELRKKLNLEQNLFTVLVMGGGQGLGPIRDIVNTLDRLNFNLQEIVVCGTNKRLYNRLKRNLKRYKKRVALLRYAQNIEELMSAADIIITKPGGITCAEALSKGLPMLIISPLPGQEANNASYLISQGAAIKADRAKDLVHILNDLYRHPEKMKKLSDSALQISNPNAASDIAQLILGL